METPQQYPDSGSGSRRRILVVDDDPSLRLLLRETLPADEFELEEVASAEEARDVARFWRPSVVLLDVSLPGLDGLSFCKQLTKGAAQGEPVVILLTGTEMTDAEARESGARAILRKPFSPLELIGLVDRLDETPSELLVRRTEGDAEQLLIYARDLSRIVEVERAQRRPLQQAYRQTVAALADALEAKDPATRLHAQRVQHYALTLTEVVDPELLDDPSLEYGFLLHDVGKIGIADQLLNKRGPLTTDERRVIELHPTIGAEILAGVAMLHGEGLKVVNFHHERWDGCGYPTGSTHLRARRCARRHDQRSALSCGAQLGAGNRSDPVRGRRAVRPEGGASVLRARATAPPHLQRARCRGGVNVSHAKRRALDGVPQRRLRPSSRFPDDPSFKGPRDPSGRGQ